jgi:DNA-binding helix-hairpin-helix protein with protein kinase domain
LEAEMARRSRLTSAVPTFGCRGVFAIALILFVFQGAITAPMIQGAMAVAGLACLIMAPVLAVLGALWAVVGLLMSPFSAYARERSARRKALKRARKAADRANQDWRVVASQYEHQFRETGARIEAACEGVRSLSREFAQERDRLVASRRAEARARFLRGQPLGSARIPGLDGPLLASLAAQNIGTAADLSPERLRAVEGVDEALAGRLTRWGQSRAARFRFEPRGCLGAAEVRDLMNRYKALQENHFDEIRRATRRLLDLNAEARERVSALEPLLEDRARALAQAQANVEVFRR